jgi:hypothetical protein
MQVGQKSQVCVLECIFGSFIEPGGIWTQDQKGNSKMIKFHTSLQ